MSLEDAIDSLTHYVNTGRPVGGFLTAVLANDLMEAMGVADESSRANLHAICVYVYNDMPSACWGSRLNIERWIVSKHKEREATA